jgi:hypothetical protein
MKHPVAFAASLGEFRGGTSLTAITIAVAVQAAAVLET